MAAFRIREDQENFNREIRQKPITSLEAVQQKRSVLGVLDNNRKTDVVPQGKQPLGESKHGIENSYQHKLAPKQTVPAVPVAQFQAFKVYEDFDEKIQQKLHDKQKRNKRKDDLSNIYSADADRLITKQEAQEKLKEKILAPSPTIEARSPDVSPQAEEDVPMSVEKSVMDEHDTCSIISKGKTCRDAFFEMSEYRDEIYSYLKEKEKLHRPKPNYMKKQPDISYSMRTILIDWLVEVTEEYKLHTETLYLAINFIDRFLSFMSVVRAKLQLVGTAAMFIAAKYEEIYPPDVGEFVYITDDTYTKRQVIRMEMLILRILEFDLSIPTTYTFITAACIKNKLQERVMHMALYLSELSLLEAEPSLETLPSIMASASIALARYYNDEEVWTSELTACTGYNLNELLNTIKFLNQLLEKAPKMDQQAIQEKYRQSKFLCVSDIEHKPLPGLDVN